MRIEAKPYKMINHVQHYDWGTRGKNAFIPYLLGYDGLDKPYAELWIGGHPKLSSEVLVGTETIKLNDFISKYPNEILGEYVAQKFNNKIPFLLKVLSANQALSIQTHPNKEQAIKLNNIDPQNYPDDNHKPEIAIALDFLIALVGFRKLSAIEENLVKYPNLADFIGAEVVEKYKTNKTAKGLQVLFTKLMENSCNYDLLESIINSILNSFNSQKELTEDEELFITLHGQYGVDVGLLVMFFLNVVKLKEGEAIFTPAGIPHAYLKGNIVECMANSDNVVRAGLTPKFKDISQLTAILTYQFGDIDLIGKEVDKNVFEYLVQVEEFSVEKISLENDTIFNDTKNSIEIILLIEGSIICNNVLISKGESILLPAMLGKFQVTSKSKSVLFRVKVPN